MAELLVADFTDGLAACVDVADCVGVSIAGDVGLNSAVFCIVAVGCFDLADALAWPSDVACRC